MRRTALLSLAILSACQEVTPPPALPASTEATSSETGAATSATGTSAAAKAAASAAVPIRRDPWSHFIERLGDLDDGARGADVKTLLEQRGRQRKQEDQQLDGELVTLQSMLVTGCAPTNLDISFKNYQDLQVAALAADRELLGKILNAAGAEGLKRLWAAGDVDQIVAQPREVMISRAQTQLPAWVADADTESGRLEAQRVVLTLNLASQGSAIRSRLDLGRFADQIARLDPTAPDTVDRVISGLELVDRRLLDEQATRFTAISGACSKIPPQQWLFLVAGGGISSYLGSLGGTAGTGNPEDRRVVTTNLLGAMGGGQTGGAPMGAASSTLGATPTSGQGPGSAGGASPSPSGQLGGGQLGGGQTGGGQAGGGQLGGGQAGGGQLGGGQLGGGQLGGSGTSTGNQANGGSQGPPTGGTANPR